MAPQLGTWSAAVKATAMALAVMVAADGGGALAAPGGPTGAPSQTVTKPEEPSKESAASASAAPDGPGTRQAAAPYSAEDKNSNPDVTTGGLEQYGSPDHNILMLGGGLLALLLIVVIAIVMIRRDRDLKTHQKSEEPGMGYDNRPSYRRSLVPDDYRETAVEDLLRRMTVMEHRLTALENGGAMRARTATPEAPPPPQRPQAGYGADQPDNHYDRRREPQGLPEDNWPVSQPVPVHGQTPEPPRAAQPGTGSVQQFADDLAELFNRANKPDFDALASQYGAESYTNDRRGDLAQLIKDVNDRFWVVPVPGRPEIALMIPGFTVKKSWAKLRQPETDHPLAHHFELRRGDRLQVIRPAVLRRNSNNFWELQQKGEVLGIS
jgi:hypothetical protein